MTRREAYQIIDTLTTLEDLDVATAAMILSGEVECCQGPNDLMLRATDGPGKLTGVRITWAEYLARALERRAQEIRREIDAHLVPE